MNKLKMNLALIALAFPLLLCAKTQRIEMDIWHRKHRTPTELFVQIEAFFDDCNKELTATSINSVPGRKGTERLKGFAWFEPGISA